MSQTKTGRTSLPGNVGMDVFSRRLSELRQKRGISRKTLGELCGLGKDMIGQYEDCKAEPKLSTLIHLADYFNVSIDYLSGRKNLF